MSIDGDWGDEAAGRLMSVGISEEEVLAQAHVLLSDLQIVTRVWADNIPPGRENNLMGGIAFAVAGLVFTTRAVANLDELNGHNPGLGPWLQALARTFYHRYCSIEADAPSGVPTTTRGQDA